MTEQELRARREGRARNYLEGYRLCLDLLELQKYEQSRAAKQESVGRCETLLAENEAFWRARMAEIGRTLSELRNGREKLILYYRYIQGESVERAAGILGISRRTAYRAWKRGLLVVGILLERREAVTIP